MSNTQKITLPFDIIAEDIPMRVYTYQRIEISGAHIPGNTKLMEPETVWRAKCTICGKVDSLKYETDLFAARAAIQRFEFMGPCCKAKEEKLNTPESEASE